MFGREFLDPGERLTIRTVACRRKINDRCLEQDEAMVTDRDTNKDGTWGY